MTADSPTIPEDIMKAAEEALDNLLCNCVESCGGAAGLRKASIEDIAKAILAERERCASIVENFASGRGVNSDAVKARKAPSLNSILMAQLIRGEA